MALSHSYVSWMHGRFLKQHGRSTSANLEPSHPQQPVGHGKRLPIADKAADKVPVEVAKRAAIAAVASGAVHLRNKAAATSPRFAQTADCVTLFPVCSFLDLLVVWSVCKVVCCVGDQAVRIELCDRDEPVMGTKVCWRPFCGAGTVSRCIMDSQVDRMLK